MSNIQVAIDGPAGSGKSSICKIVAKELNFTHIDTGAMFRAITLYALREKADLTVENSYDFLADIRLSYQDNKIYLNGEDVSQEIRESDVTKNVSQVSKMKVVRDRMLIWERELASQGNILMDGRDIGSVVLPKADVKIYLTASVEARAKRRYDELIAKGQDVKFEDVLKLYQFDQELSALIFSMISKVIGNTFTDEPLAFLFEDAKIQETISPYYMARIVDFEGFISQFPFKPDNMERKSYTPQPEDLSGVQLPAELEELAELLARNVHEVWAAGRLAEGWTWGPVRDDALKQHPCLVPYEELPEEEKDYDRRTAAGTLKLIVKLGFRISADGGR